jgi:hypothetical protein
MEGSIAKDRLEYLQSSLDKFSARELRKSQKHLSKDSFPILLSHGNVVEALLETLPLRQPHHVLSISFIGETGIDSGIFYFSIFIGYGSLTYSQRSADDLNVFRIRR